MLDLIEGLFGLLGWLLNAATIISQTIDLVGMVASAIADELGWLGRRVKRPDGRSEPF